LTSGTTSTKHEIELGGLEIPGSWRATRPASWTALRIIECPVVERHFSTGTAEKDHNEHDE
jgi:hypothetical protein